MYVALGGEELILCALPNILFKPTMGVYGCPVICQMGIKPPGITIHHRRLDCLLNRLFDADKKYQSSVSLAFVRGIHRWPMNSPHKGPGTLKMLPVDDVNMWKWHVKCHSPDRKLCMLIINSNLTDVLLGVRPILVNSRSLEIGCYNDRIALKFNRHLGSAAAKVPVKFQRAWQSLNPYVTAWRLHEILR